MGWMSLLGLDTKVAQVRSNVSELAIAAEDRWELAQLEWAEHKSALLRLTVLGVALLCLGTVAALALSLAVLVSFWDTPWRVAAGWAVAGFWLLVVLLVWLRITYWAQSLNGLFALTRAELKRDWQTLKNTKEKDHVA